MAQPGDFMQQDSPTGSPSSSVVRAAGGGGPPVSSPEVIMTQASGIEGATYEQQQNLVSNTMKNLSIRPPIGQTPLFQEQAIVPMSVNSISMFFDAAQKEYMKAKESNFRSIDWSVPFKIPTQRILFHLWSRRFAISYAQFYSENSKDARIGDYDFGSASSRLRMGRSFFAQQIVAWDVLIGNDSGKWLDRILIGAESREGEQLAQQFENFLMAVANQEARGGSRSFEPRPSLASTSGVTQEQLTEQIDRVNALQSQLEETEANLSRARLDRIKNSVNNVNLSFYMVRNDVMDRLQQEKKELQERLDQLQLTMFGSESQKDQRISELSEMIDEKNAQIENMAKELDEQKQSSITALQNVREVNRTLGKQLEDQRETIIRLNKEITELKKQVEFAIRFSVTDSSLPLLFVQRDDAQDRLVELTRELDQIRQELENRPVQEDIDSLTREKEQLMRELEAIRSGQQTAENATITNLTSQKESLERRVADLSSRITDIETKSELRQKRVLELEREKIDLRTNVDQLTQAIADLEQTNRDLQASAREVTTLQTSVSSLTSRVQQAEELARELSEKLGPLEKFANDLGVAQVDDPIQYASSLDRRSAELKQIEENYQALQSLLLEAKDQVIVTAQPVTAVSVARAVKRGDFSACRDNTRLEEQNRQLEQDLSKVRTELQQKTLALSAQETASAELAKEKTELEQTLSNVQEKLRETKQDLETQKVANAALAQTNRELQIKVEENRENTSIAAAVRDAKNMMNMGGTAREAFTKMAQALKTIHDRRTEYGVVPTEHNPVNIVNAIMNSVQTIKSLQSERIRDSLGMPDQVLGQILAQYANPTPSFVPIFAARA